jgi:hypothetical protein
MIVGPANCTWLNLESCSSYQIANGEFDVDDHVELFGLREDLGAGSRGRAWRVCLYTSSVKTLKSSKKKDIRLGTRDFVLKIFAPDEEGLEGKVDAEVENWQKAWGVKVHKKNILGSRALVMPFYPQITDTERNLATLRKVAAAVQDLHNKGFCHRDLTDGDKLKWHHIRWLNNERDRVIFIDLGKDHFGECDEELKKGLDQILDCAMKQEEMEMEMALARTSLYDDRFSNPVEDFMETLFFDADN